MSGIHRGAWAVEARGKMNDQTKADVDAISAAFKVSKEKAQKVFDDLNEKRQWKRWEALSIADVAKTLAKGEL